MFSNKNSKVDEDDFYKTMQDGGSESSSALDDTDNFRNMTKHDLDKFDGSPINRDRKCTDTKCLFIFAYFVTFLIYFTYMAFTNGNIKYILGPADADGQTCGVKERLFDVQLEDTEPSDLTEYPYLLITDFSS